MPLSPFRYDGFRPARRKSRSSRVGDARLIYRSLATYAIACARFVTLERVAEDPSVTNHARNSQWNINELLQNIRSLARNNCLYIFDRWRFIHLRIFDYLKKIGLDREVIFLFFFHDEKIPISGNLFATSQIFRFQSTICFTLMYIFFRPTLYDN